MVPRGNAGAYESCWKVVYGPNWATAAKAASSSLVVPVGSCVPRGEAAAVAGSLAIPSPLGRGVAGGALKSANTDGLVEAPGIGAADRRFRGVGSLPTVTIEVTMVSEGSSAAGAVSGLSADRRLLASLALRRAALRSARLILTSRTRTVAGSNANTFCAKTKNSSTRSSP